ncbi:MAG TPA: sulfite exporter TauE/SafE family protein [Candidatus Limnocylindrales bacterium]|nr:sulfite exporter TauE/SafE family protein [Candidatus Limnocylindrales bacterium]
MNYSLSFVLWLFGSASIAGFFGALLGVGGGIFIVPVMVLVFHLPIKIAVAASIVSVIATSNAGGSSYVDQRITNLRLGMFLEVSTTIGALSGSVLALYLHEWMMMMIFAALLLYMGVSAFLQRKLDDRRIAANDFSEVKPDRLSAFLNLGGSYHDEAADRTVNYVVTGTSVGTGICYLAGLASGLLGVGGGVLKVSAMNAHMNVPMKAAIGTSKLMIGVTAAVSSILFFLAGLIHFYVVAPVAVGTTVGATVGTMIMNRLHSVWLKWLLALLMIYLSYGMLANALALRFHVHLPTLG